ncbi:MAG: heme-binding domain-containing protein [Bacteroidota bacterium]|nr:heme-binding domain-containing protein [Bacteroidota bacterium]
MRKIIRIILIILLIALIAIQFVRPQKNASQEIAANQVEARINVPENIHKMLKVSCYDCHSNTTYYPWYWQAQPVAWFLNNHINDGKRHLNFSEFANYPISKQYKKLDQISKEVKSGDMPLTSYTLIHRDAVLDENQKLAIENWTTDSRKLMEAKYPPDSLPKK